MKKKYIKTVSKHLTVSLKNKKVIIRDLEEMFTSSIEHGETEEQIISRLGNPKEFAAAFNDDNSARVKILPYLWNILAIILLIAEWALIRHPLFSMHSMIS